MGFPSIDLFIRDILLEAFTKAKIEPEEVIEDTFEERPAIEKSEIAAYIMAREFTGDIKDRDSDGKNRHVYILPHFPMADIPFPQIGISLGEQPGTDRHLSDVIEQVEAIKNGVAYGIRTKYGHYAQASYTIDIITATKNEVIWLSRLVERFICEHFGLLASVGMIELNISSADVRLDPNLVPSDSFVRQLRISGKVVNTYSTVEPYTEGTYSIGVNAGLE